MRTQKYSLLVVEMTREGYSDIRELFVILPNDHYYQHDQNNTQTVKYYRNFLIIKSILSYISNIKRLSSSPSLLSNKSVDITALSCTANKLFIRYISQNIDVLKDMDKQKEITPFLNNLENYLVSFEQKLDINISNARLDYTDKIKEISNLKNELRDARFIHKTQELQLEEISQKLKRYHETNLKLESDMNNLKQRYDIVLQTLRDCQQHNKLNDGEDDDDDTVDIAETNIDILIKETYDKIDEMLNSISSVLSTQDDDGLHLWISSMRERVLILDEQYEQDGNDSDYGGNNNEERQKQSQLTKKIEYLKSLKEITDDIDNKFVDLLQQN